MFHSSSNNHSLPSFCSTFTNQQIALRFACSNQPLNERADNRAIKCGLQRFFRNLPTVLFVGFVAYVGFVGIQKILQNPTK
jgi:hypothetical protein